MSSGHVYAMGLRLGTIELAHFILLAVPLISWACIQRWHMDAICIHGFNIYIYVHKLKAPLRYLWALAITLVYRSLLEVHMDFLAINLWLERIW